ncbi:hypothetical protein [Pseudonocardia alni]|uniref:hypothetical protein n=1 Tax=Pseudonocardia alni TaxID=33907 RepID=UPI0033166DB1
METTEAEPRHPRRPISTIRFRGNIRSALDDHCRATRQTMNGAVNKIVAEALGVDEQPRP